MKKVATDLELAMKAEGFTDEQVALGNENFPKFYLLEDHSKGDVHGSFANAVGISRNTAKSLAFRYMYSKRSWMMDKWRKERSIMLTLARELSKVTGESATAIIDRVEDALCSAS